MTGRIENMRQRMRSAMTSVKKRGFRFTRKPEQSLPRTLKEALRPNEQRAIMVTEVNRPFTVVGVNAAWESLCGYTCGEALGKSPEMLQGEESNFEGLREAMDRLFNGEDVTYDTVNYRKDGSMFNNQLTMGPLFDEKTGEMTHFVGILKNVGEFQPNSQ